MEDSSELKNAVGSFVESLEKEHKNNKLIEDNSKKEQYKKSDGFFELVSKLKKIIEMACIGEKISIETDEKKHMVKGPRREVPLEPPATFPDSSNYRRRPSNANPCGCPTT